MLDIKINENILTTPITFLSTASAAALLGAKIHFVDVNKTSGLISIPSLKEKIHDIREPIKAITLFILQVKLSIWLQYTI